MFESDQFGCGDYCHSFLADPFCLKMASILGARADGPVRQLKERKSLWSAYSYVLTCVSGSDGGST